MPAVTPHPICSAPFPLQYYLRKRFYEPCGLTHWMPTGAPSNMDYSGETAPHSIGSGLQVRIRSAPC